jgi:hypothetical protein
VGKYVEYDYYDSLYPMRLTEDEFDAYLPSAEAYIDLITYNRAANAAGYKAERVRQAVCAVIGEMAAQDATKNAGGARLTSVSNDGYTETYRAASGGTAEEAYAIRQMAMRWLSGTGLVSAL